MKMILWQYGRPSLYIVQIAGNRWNVINGGWVLVLNDGDLTGVVEATGMILSFDRKTIAPEGNDLVEVMKKAEDDQTITS